MKQKNSINFNQPKYVLPLISLPFVLLFGYLTIDMFAPKPQAVSAFEITEDINANLPEAVITSKNDLGDKFDAYKDTYKKEKDYSGIQKLEFNEEQETSGSIYTDEEIRDIEVAHQKSADEAKKIRDLQKQYFGDESGGRTGEPKGGQLDEMALLKKQMAFIDSIRNAAELAEQQPQVRNNRVKQIQQDDEPEALEAFKVGSANDRHFNTIKAGQNLNFISAMLDEAQTVVDGSRIRIRLLDDIFVGKQLLKKGTYLFGLVSGFSAQRVIVNITSVLVDGEILKTNLTIYDNDGMKGLYVPTSDFRELLKQAGSQGANQQITIDQQNGGFEQFAYGALQDVYRSTTQALTKKIKQNKAKLKYDSVVYLINEKDIKNKK